jgi:uncharacterized damage-inducible protein DinB
MGSKFTELIVDAADPDALATFWQAVLGSAFSGVDVTETYEPDLIGSERDVLINYLNKMRNAVVRTSEGLTDEQQRAPGVPSGTNLLGTLQHLTEVEAHWFRRVFRGVDFAMDRSMNVPRGVTRDAVVAAYRAECARSDEIIRACPDLSTLAARTNPGEEDLVALRRIAAHMIEETARHAGQCDILREMIDGTTDD